MSLNKIPYSKRLGSAFLDFFAINLIIGIPFGIIERIIKVFSGHFFSGIGSPESDLFIIYILFFLMLIKDIFNGQSFNKALLGFQVVDNKSGLPANDFKCVLRNTTILIWPLEVIVLVISTERRLGDVIAGTKIVSVEKKTLSNWFIEVKNKKYTLSTLIGIFIALIYMGIVWWGMKMIV